MKKLLILLCTTILLVSCVSTSIDYYSTKNISGNKIFMQLDQSVSSVNTGAIGYTTNYGWTFIGSSSETIKLGTIKNKEFIKSTLQSKGFVIVNSLDEADIVMVGESNSSSDCSSVTLGFYDKLTHDLLFTCDGKYDLGFGIQDDLNKALKKALESVPNAK